MHISYTCGRITKNDEFSKRWLWNSSLYNIFKWQYIPWEVTRRRKRTLSIQVWPLGGKQKTGRVRKIKLVRVDGPMRSRDVMCGESVLHGRRMWTCSHWLEGSLLTFWVCPVFRQVEGGQSCPVHTLSSLPSTQQSFLFGVTYSGLPHSLLRINSQCHTFLSVAMVGKRCFC